MSHGRRTWHTVCVLACVAVIAGSTGCRRSPFQRLVDDSQAVSGASLSGDRAEIPQLLPVPDEEIAPAKVLSPQAGAGTSKAAPAIRESAVSHQEASASDGPIPTPLLDAALQRANAVEQLQRQAIRSEASQSPERPATVSRPAVPDQAKGTRIPVTPQPCKDLQETRRQPVATKAGPNPQNRDRPTPADRATSWKDSVGKLKKLAQESASQSGTVEGAALWNVRAEVMDWMSSENSSTANEAILKKAVVTIAEALKTKTQDTSRQSSEIPMAVLEREDRVPLGITNLRVCRNVLGFGSFEPLETSGLKAGQPMILYCELTGLRYRSKGSSFVTRLDSRVELVNVRDGTKIWEQSLGEAEYECHSRRRDNYVNVRITLPSSVKPGDYRLRLMQTDLVADQSASSTLPVTIMR